MAFFFSAVYSESLYLALSVGLFWRARHGRWACVGVLGALAGATRSTGLVLLLPALLIYLYGPREDRAAGLARGSARGCGARLRPRYRLRRDAAVARAAARGRRRCTAPTSRSPAAMRSRRFTPRRSGGGTSRAPSSASGTDLRAAFEGARQLLSFQRHHVYFPTAGGSPFVDRRAQPDAARLPARARSRRSSASLRRLPLAYGAYVLAALALPLSYPVARAAADVAAALPVVLFPLRSGSRRGWPSTRALQRARAGALGAADGRSSRRSSRPGTGSPSERRTTRRSAPRLDRAGRARAAAATRRSPDTAGRRGRRRSRWSAGSCSPPSAALLRRPPGARARRRTSRAAHTPPGLTIADTVVQDVGVRARRRLLRAARRPRRCARGSSACARPAVGWRARCGHDRRAARRVRRRSASPGRKLVHPEKEKLLEQLGTNEGAALLVLSAALTCVVAPIVRGVPVPRLHLHGAAQLARDAARGADHRAAVRRRARRLGAGARPRAAGGARLRAVPALPLHGLAVPVHRRPLAEQLGRVREPRGLELGRRSLLVVGALAGDRLLVARAASASA